MGRATSKGNEAKSKMKQPSDMPMPRFEHGWEQTVLKHATARPRRRSGSYLMNHIRGDIHLALCHLHLPQIVEIVKINSS